MGRNDEGTGKENNLMGGDYGLLDADVDDSLDMLSIGVIQGLYHAVSHKGEGVD